MTKRWMRRLLLALVATFIVLVGLVRYNAVVIKNADGRVLGYAADTQEWLAMEYPSHPASADGPYVYTQDGKRWQLQLRPNVAGVVEAARSPLEADEVVVLTDQPTPVRFTVPLRTEYPRPPTSVPMPAKLLVSSDFEGEFDAFTTLMQANGVIDADLRWSFGTGQVLLVGDMVDRGRNVVPLLWLVYRLEAEAQAAGGAIHYVLGNHEQRLLNGQAQDVDEKYLATLQLAGQTHRELWDERSELGRWLRSKPVVVRVGDVLGMHGGVSPEVLALAPTLEEIDRLAAANLTLAPDDVTDERAKAIVWDRAGVLWYRGLARGDERTPKATPEHLQAVLKHFGVRWLAIGHTLAQHVGQDYDGALLRTDVLQAEGVNEAMLIEGGQVFRIDTTGTRSALEPVINLD